MKLESLTDLVSQLSPDEQAAVRDFIQYIRKKKQQAETTTFLSAVDDFIAAHPELLRRLAQ